MIKLIIFDLLVSVIERNFIRMLDDWQLEKPEEKSGWTVNGKYERRGW
jgi:hypothetical protein